LNAAVGFTGTNIAIANPFNFVTPITDSGVANADVTTDDFGLVADTGDHKTSRISAGNNATNLPQPGDIFRGVVKQTNGTTITHEGIVAAYDASTKSLWLIDNWVSDHSTVSGTQYTTGTAEIGYHQFNVNSAATPVAGDPVVVGPYGIYRANSESLNDNIIGSNGNDYLGGSSGNDTIFGGLGNDTRWGGTGTNTIGYANGWGQDTIKDWMAGTNNLIDMTTLASVGVHSLANLSQPVVNGNDIISHGTDTLTLQGVNNTLMASSIRFA
jgi:hypothetical protein